VSSDGPAKTLGHSGRHHRCDHPDNASVLAWKGSNIAWKILAILFNVCPLAADLLAVLSGMSTSTMVNTAVGTGLISWGIAWVFAGASLSTRPRLVLAR
jgi:hypothetical protein